MLILSTMYFSRTGFPLEFKMEVTEIHSYYIPTLIIMLTSEQLHNYIGCFMICVPYCLVYFMMMHHVYYLEFNYRVLCCSGLISLDVLLLMLVLWTCFVFTSSQLVCFLKISTLLKSCVWSTLLIYSVLTIELTEI